MCITFVRRHIFNLRRDQIFVTRDLLKYGSRGGIDTILSRMVKDGLIVRVARGVFVRCDSRIPSNWEIAAAKAQAFNKRITRRDAEFACEFGLTDQDPEQLTFSVVGRGSSFGIDGNVIRLKGIRSRKLVFNDTKAGRAIRALWHLGKNHCHDSQIKHVTAHFQRQDKSELSQFRPWMPTWLLKFFPAPLRWQN